MNLLRAATLVTPDAEAAAARYVQWMDYSVVERGLVPADLAASWGAPASTGRHAVTIQPASGADVFIRFVEGDPVPDYQPLRTHGWAALEICNQDVLGVNERMKTSPFEIIGPPKRIDGLPTIHPMQVKGPDDEIVYLTEIVSPGNGLPYPGSFIDKLFILVLACSDMNASADWFKATLGLQVGAPMTIIYNMINDAFGLAADARHTLATATWEGDVFLEFDQYPAEATPRPGHAGALPPGIAMTTLKHPAFDTVTGDWIIAPTVREGPVYGGRRAGVLRGPDGVLIEVVEA
jgi:catechol 2,3-dioxygenase-like lactoylglutathione lyase family enzyme